jgi:agmatine deiminase
VSIVHERGNLEFNGTDTVIVNWSVLGDKKRNPGYSREQAEKHLKHHLGVKKVIFIEGVPDGDLTNGHVDAIARFVNERTAVVPKCTDSSVCRPGGNDDGIYEQAAKKLKANGFEVLREPLEGITLNGEKVDANYTNWLVGNGFVMVGGFDHPSDIKAKKRLQRYFPGRDIHIVGGVTNSWLEGGGVHCHTNDRPALRRPVAKNRKQVRVLRHGK